MAKDDLVSKEGVITEVNAHGSYLVELENGKIVPAKLSGRMRKFYIKVVRGDRVTLGFSPYDPSHGLILYRHPAKNAPPKQNR